MSRHPPTYIHKQPATVLTIVLIGASAAMFLSFIVFAERSELKLIVLIPFLLVLASAWTFSALTISVDDEKVRWRFGPGVIFGSVELDSIVSAEATRTSILAGWGIRFTRRGMLYNVSGFDAVHIRRAVGRGVLLGTDEPQALAAAIREAMDRRKNPKRL